MNGRQERSISARCSRTTLGDTHVTSVAVMPALVQKPVCLQQSSHEMMNGRQERSMTAFKVDFLYSCDNIISYVYYMFLLFLSLYVYIFVCMYVYIVPIYVWGSESNREIVSSRPCVRALWLPSEIRFQF